MTPEQRKEVFDAAEAMLNNREDASPELGLDGELKGFVDPVEDGVWIRVWMKVPAALIPGYTMQPPAAPSVVEVVRDPPKTI